MASCRGLNGVTTVCRQFKSSSPCLIGLRLATRKHLHSSKIALLSCRPRVITLRDTCLLLSSKETACTGGAFSLLRSELCTGIAFPTGPHACVTPQVKKWTKGVDIFSKDFLFMPVNSHLHWSLTIICFPGHVYMTGPGNPGRRGQRAAWRQEEAHAKQAPVILTLDSLGSSSDTFNMAKSGEWETGTTRGRVLLCECPWHESF